MTLTISADKFIEFRSYLAEDGYAFEERPYQQFLARKGASVVNLYSSGKIVFGGTDDDERRRVEEYLTKLEASEVTRPKKDYPAIEVSGSRIGTDEVGKGDYFGPLVIGGVLVTEAQVKQLQELGVKDSKALSDTTIKNLAVHIRKILPVTQREVIVINPIKYNMLHKEMGNINGLLGWGHARAIENLAAAYPTCEVAVADQFGDQSYIEKALMQKGKRINLIQSPKAEREVTVAAASILARDEFINRMREMSITYGLEFPKGSTEVIPMAEKFVLKYGARALLNVAKVHFSITKKIPNVVAEELHSIVPASFQEELPTAEAKAGRDIRLECYNLIDSFEPDFRRVIAARLKSYYGDAWWETCIDTDIREKAASLKRKEMDRGVNVELIDCLEMDHYRLIITDTHNWKNVFELLFKDKEGFLARLKILKDIRNPVAHSRGALKYTDKLGVISAIGWMNDKTKGV